MTPPKGGDGQLQKRKASVETGNPNPKIQRQLTNVTNGGINKRYQLRSQGNSADKTIKRILKPNGAANRSAEGSTTTTTNTSTTKQANATPSTSQSNTLAGVPVGNQFIVNDVPLDAFNTDGMDLDGDNRPAVNTHAKHRTQSITVINSNPTEMHNFLSSTVSSGKYEIKLLSNGIRINVQDKVEWQAVQNRLKQLKKQFFFCITRLTHVLKKLHCLAYMKWS